MNMERADRQANRQADRQANRQTDRQAGRQADRQAGEWPCRHTVRQTGRQTDRKAGRKAGNVYKIQFTMHLSRKMSNFILVQQICGDNQPKGSVSDKSTKISKKLAEMILFEISYGPKLNKSKMAVIFRMAAKF